MWENRMEQPEPLYTQPIVLGSSGMLKQEKGRTQKMPGPVFNTNPCEIFLIKWKFRFQTVAYLADRFA